MSKLCRMKRLALAFSLSLVAACGPGKEMLQAQPLDAGGIKVMPEQVYVDDDKLFVRVTVLNGTQQMITVMRDQIDAKLPDGNVIHRSQGSFSTHQPYMIPPGGAHAVYVDFQAQGFDWRLVPSVQIDFSNGVLTNGNPTPMPPFVVSH